MVVAAAHDAERTNDRRTTTAAAARRNLVAAAAVLWAATTAGCCCCEIFFGNFARFTCRSKQSEAKGNLKALATAQAAFFADQQRYGQLDEIDFEPRGETIRYQYVLLSADADGFVAEARGVDEMKGDVWRVDEDGAPENVENTCGPSDEPAPERPPGDGDGVQHVAY